MHSISEPGPAPQGFVPQTSPSAAAAPVSAADGWLQSDLATLQSHMRTCERSRGNFFEMRSLLESVVALASPRIVTSTSLCVACCMVAAFAFA